MGLGEESEQQWLPNHNQQKEEQWTILKPNILQLGKEINLQVEHKWWRCPTRLRVSNSCHFEMEMIMWYLLKNMDHNQHQHERRTIAGPNTLTVIMEINPEMDHQRCDPKYGHRYPVCLVSNWDYSPDTCRHFLIGTKYTSQMGEKGKINPWLHNIPTVPLPFNDNSSQVQKGGGRLIRNYQLLI